MSLAVLTPNSYINKNKRNKNKTKGKSPTFYQFMGHKFKKTPELF